MAGLVRSLLDIHRGQSDRRHFRKLGNRVERALLLLFRLGVMETRHSERVDTQLCHIQL